MKTDLYLIKDSHFIKKYSENDLKVLAQQIRELIIYSTHKNGGHLSPNLGSVEATIAMHYVYDCYKDFFYFDIGHQAYAHKILTGRASLFENLRKRGGAEAFPKKYESKFDIYEGGRSSSALSASLGHAMGQSILDKPEKSEIVAFIGDAAIQNGVAFEFVNNVMDYKCKVTVVLNQNAMSISKDIGSLGRRLKQLSKKHLNKHIDKKTNKLIFKELFRDSESLRNPFHLFGIDYLGPIDGNNISHMIQAFEYAKKLSKTVFIHIITIKGKGLKYAENDSLGIYHGVPPGFNLKTGEFPKSKYVKRSFLVCYAVSLFLDKIPNLVMMSPAMAAPTYTNLLAYKNKYPRRVFDNGINEELQALLGLGMHNAGILPFLDYYSSFLSRAYDQLIQDITRARSSAIFTMHDSGFATASGDTHHTLYDLSMVLTLPNTYVVSPRTTQDILNCVCTGLDVISKETIAFFIKTSEARIEYEKDLKLYKPKKLVIGKWLLQNHIENPDAYIISYDYNLDLIENKIHEENLNIQLINAIFLKPLDIELLKQIIKTDKPIFVYEDAYWNSGLGSYILSTLNILNISSNTIHIVGAKLRYYRTGTNAQLKNDAEISIESLFNKIKKAI